MKRLMFKMFVLLGCIIATLSFAAEKMKSIVTTCDETKVELTCTKQNETGCLASKLRFQPKGMPEHFIKLPKEIKEASYYAAGLSCTENKKNEHYKQKNHPIRHYDLSGGFCVLNFGLIVLA